MINIGICDDDPIWRETARKILEEYQNNHEISFQIYVLPDETALEALEDPLDILLQDIVLHDRQAEGDDGITAVRKINERWPDCQIVYVTDYLYYATDVYQTDHVYFALKSQFADRVDEILEKVFHQLTLCRQRLVFRQGKKQISILAADIRYFERNLRVTKMVMQDRTEVIPESFHEIIQKVSPFDFVRCHTSFIINLACIREVASTTVLLRTGEEIPVSRRYRDSLKEAFALWALGRI